MFGTFLGSFRFVLGSFAEENLSHRRSIAGLQPTDRLNKRITSANPRQRRSIATHLPIDREERRSCAQLAERSRARESEIGQRRRRSIAAISRPIATWADRSPSCCRSIARTRGNSAPALFYAFCFYFWVFSELFRDISEFLKLFNC